MTNPFQNGILIVVLQRLLEEGIQMGASYHSVTLHSDVKMRLCVLQEVKE